MQTFSSLGIEVETVSKAKKSVRNCQQRIRLVCKVFNLEVYGALESEPLKIGKDTAREKI